MNFKIMALFFLGIVFLTQFLHAEPYKLVPAKGSFPDFTPHGTQPGLAFPVASADDCASCHRGSNADLAFSPTATWSGSMMANATRDPLFWAAVDIANQDLPGVGDFCIRCHTPMGFYQGHTKDGTSNPDYANGCQLIGTVTTQDNTINDYQGVNCHFCHRQNEKGPNQEALITNNSNVWLDDVACDNPDSNNQTQPCRKGPYNPPLFDIHEWEYSTFLSKGENCGTCHDVSSPEVLNNGVLTVAKNLWDNGVETQVAMPIERTFSEWNNSVFSDLVYRDGFGGDIATTLPNLSQGQSCQECHMPQSYDPDTRACVLVATGSRTGNLRKHEFAGGNSWMPAVIKSIYGAALDTSGFSRSDAYDRTVLSALNQLQSQSAIVETSLISATSNQVEVKVKVTNLTGHKLPTGYPEGRRMWIHLVVKDSNGTMVYESGAYDESTAVLSTDAAIKIYESKQGIWDTNTASCITESNGQQLFHFVLNNCIAKDNRIPPLGFRGGNNLELKPVAYTYPVSAGNSNALVNFDETSYVFTIANTVVYPVTVTATLKYQTASKDYIEFLDSSSSTVSENELCNRTQTVGPANESRGAFMKSLWQNNGQSAPVDMDSSSIQISL